MTRFSAATTATESKLKLSGHDYMTSTSTAEATLNKLASPHGRPISCKPIGRPCLSWPTWRESDMSPKYNFSAFDLYSTKIICFLIQVPKLSIRKKTAMLLTSATQKVSVYININIYKVVILWSGSGIDHNMYLYDTLIPLTGTVIAGRPRRFPAMMNRIR